METIETICCATGKSGGHIIPNLQWAKQYNPNAHILFFSADTPLDQQLLAGKVTTHVPLNLSVPAWYLMPLFCVRFAHAILKSLWYLLRNKPSKVLSTGGITALPVCIAAYCLRIPIELFELNATPGTTTRWLAPLATKIHICFDSAKIYFDENKMVVSEYPVRFEKKYSEKQNLNDSDRTTIFIQGGSQGSVSLNKKVKQWIEDNPALCPQITIIHQTGSYDSFDWKKFYTEKKIPATVFEFEDDLQNYYQAANLVICRSGAGQLFESLYFRKKCITIPLELPGNTHQLDNALVIATLYPQLFTILRQHEPLTTGMI